MDEKKLKYKRVLLKLSGEALAVKNEDHTNSAIFDNDKIGEIAAVIKKMTEMGAEIGIVIGAGNIWRGEYGKGVQRARADQMGMLGTMINCLRMEDALEKAGCDAVVMSPIGMTGFAKPYDFRSAVESMKQGKVVLFGAGLGMPFVTTDTTAVVRAAEIEADVILMAKNIDGIYVKDPRDKNGDIDPTVPKFKSVSYDYALKNELKATDIAASAIAEKQGIDMYVFALSDPENILRVLDGEEIGTLVTSDEKSEPVMQ